jgi:hypothetical protein
MDEQQQSMNIRSTTAGFPAPLTTLAAAMLAGLGVVALVDAGPLPRFEMLAVVDAPGGVQVIWQDFAAAIEHAAARLGLPADHGPV